MFALLFLTIFYLYIYYLIRKSKCVISWLFLRNKSNFHYNFEIIFYVYFKVSNVATNSQPQTTTTSSLTNGKSIEEEIAKEASLIASQLNAVTINMPSPTITPAAYQPQNSASAKTATSKAQASANIATNALSAISLKASMLANFTSNFNMSNSTTGTPQQQNSTQAQSSNRSHSISAANTPTGTSIFSSSSILDLFR